MGGFFGITSRKDCMLDVFFGVDYHSHLGTRRAGMAAWDPEIGLQRKIHNICNAPFRTRFEHIFEEMKGTAIYEETKPVFTGRTEGALDDAWRELIKTLDTEVMGLV